MKTSLRAAICAAVLVGYGGVALAGAALQGVLTATAGVTDNVTSAPNETVPGSPGRQTDLIVTLTPGLSFTAGGARAVFRLSYLLNAIFYAKNTSADLFTNTFAGSAFFIPSKRSTMTIDFGISQGRQSGFNNTVDSSNPSLQLTPPAILDLVNANASETFVYEIAKTTRFYETAGFATTYQLGGPEQSTPLTQDVPGRIGFDHSFPHDLIALDVLYDFANYPTLYGPTLVTAGIVDPHGVITPGAKQLTLTPTGRWGRDFSYFVNLRANIGAVVIMDVENTKHTLTQPAGGVGLNLFSRLVQFDLAYQHGAVTNLYFRSTFLTDSVLLRGSFKLGEKSGLSLQLGLGYGYQQQVNLDTTLGSVGQSIIGDVTLAYSPPTLPWSSFFLRYSLIDQIGRSSDPLPLPDYYRNTLLFGLAFIYPPVIQLEVPKKALGIRTDGRDAGTITSSKSSIGQ
jgi:hypothetical protein